MQPRGHGRSVAPEVTLAQLPEVVTVAEAAVVARCSRASIYRAVEQGVIPAARTSTGGRRAGVRIHRDVLERWLRGELGAAA